MHTDQLESNSRHRYLSYSVMVYLLHARKSGEGSSPSLCICVVRGCVRNRLLKKNNENLFALPPFLALISLSLYFFYNVMLHFLQVQFTTIWHCHPLCEDEFRDAIKENYFTSKKFNFGLSRNQVQFKRKTSIFTFGLSKNQVQ